MANHVPSPDCRSQFERLAANGFQYQQAMNRVYLDLNTGTTVAFSFWTHHNKPSVVIIDDGKHVATFQRVSY